MRRLIWAAAMLPALALGAAACGSGGSNSGPAPATASPPAASAPAPGSQAPSQPSATGTLVVVHDSKLGRILTDSQGRTLYLFEKDSPTMSACDGACAVAWPPLTTTGTPQPGPGVSAADLGTITRADHRTEVTYHGHPLYYYVGDHNPGDTNGEGSTAFGAGWYVLDPSGNKIDND
ncbi:COG4315 family predicted lipoprotein [Kitasatospora sp. KL5]|uniref:COG4315 family predicted lipoprotein n=1 Tax=Kitasatospora sp. KL5 TaxID=3425125 RepID=UPI003D6DC6CE